MRKTRTILLKEWEEMFRNRIVIWTLFGPPILFVVLAAASSIGTSLAMSPADLSESDMAEIAALTGEMCTDLAVDDCMQVYMGSIYLVLFLILPTILPAVFASYSIIGEKVGKTLEPLLAAPVSTTELLAGKALAAVIPAVLATWLAASIYYAMLSLTVGPAVLGKLADPAWLLAIGVTAPLLAVTTVLIAMMVSSRVQDPRTAQQVSAMVVLPVIGGLIAQSFGLMIMTPSVVALVTALLAAVNAGLLWLAVRVFARDAILTRWK